MEIGIPKEIRRNESRVSLVPQDVEKLVHAGHDVHVQEDAGIAAGFAADTYEKAGATISSTLNDYDLIVGVKEPPLSLLKRGTTIMAYLHVEKGQNSELLSKLKEGWFLSYAYEEIRDQSGGRLVNLGFEAGIVGIVEGLRILGIRLEDAKGHNPFKGLIHVVKYGSKKQIYEAVAELGCVDEINVVIIWAEAMFPGVYRIYSGKQTSTRPFYGERRPRT